MTDLSPDYVPSPGPDVETCEFDGERLVWTGATLHRLDAVGGVVWDCFDGRRTIADIATLLASRYGADEATVHDDISALCAELFDVGLLAGTRPDPVDPLPFVRPGKPPGTPLDLDRSWAYESGRFRALDHDFGIRTDDGRLAAHFERSLRSFSLPGLPACWYSVVVPSGPDEAYGIYLDGEGLLVAPDADAVARYLLWHVNYEAIHRASSHLLIHAAGAVAGGRAVVLPGEMNAGKTTLVAGLVLDGFGFLTDELVALNLQTGLIDPYPRPLNIGQGSWEVLSSLRPPDRDVDDPLPAVLWHVDPTVLRGDAVAGPTPLGWVVAPRFTAGEPTQLEPLSRPEALTILHRHAFNKYRLGSPGVRALIEAVRGARCARLPNGDLQEAVVSVRRFVESTAPDRAIQSAP